MSVTAASFRQSFPAFGDATAFPNDAIEFWLGVAQIMLLTQVWGQSSPTPDVPPTALIDVGAMLFVAHNLALEQQNAKVAANGGVPGGGGSTGVVSSESVGSVSRSYDTSAGLMLDGGPWNLTTYGTRFLFMARLVGKGGVQLGAGVRGGPMPWMGPPGGPGGFYQW